MNELLTPSSQIALLTYSISVIGIAIAMTAMLKPIRELLLIPQFRIISIMLVIIHLITQAMIVVRIVCPYLGGYTYDAIIIILVFIAGMWIMQLLIPLVFYQFEGSPQPNST